MRNLGRAETASATRDELKQSVLNGKGKMPAHAKKLAPADIEAVVDYVTELARAIRGEKPQRPDRGGEKPIRRDSASTDRGNGIKASRMD